MQAIQTEYKGYRFRSRLEARWAVFFDAIEVGWEYEKEGFELPSGRYLPDFWIPLNANYLRPYPQGTPPTPGFWVEIKPCQLTEQEERLCAELSVFTGHCVYSAAGMIGEDEDNKWHPKGKCAKTRRDDSYECPNGLLFYLIAEASRLSEGDKLYPFELLRPAIKSARSARFEHGECGAAR